MSGRKESSLRVFVRFLKIMGKPLPLFLFAMIIHMVGDNLFNVTLSLFVKNVVEMAQYGDISRFAQVLLISLIAGFIWLMIFFIFGTIYDIEAKRGNAKVQKLVIEKALRMPMSYYDQHHSGEIVSKLLNDADVASQIFTSRLRRVTTPIMSVIVYFIPMLIMNWRLALCLLAVNVISLVVNSKFISPMKKLGRETSEKKRDMTKSVTTIVAGIGTIKMYSGCKELLKSFKHNVSEYLSTRKKGVGMGSMLSGINTFFDVVCALGFLMISIYFVNNDMASLSSVAAIYTLYGSFSYNFLELGKYLPELMNCIARVQILFEYLEAEEECGIIDKVVDNIKGTNMSASTIGKLVNMETGEGHTNAIELQNVVFDYDKVSDDLNDTTDITDITDTTNKTKTHLYNNVSLSVPYGNSTAITGKSGCGKSTLFKLLLGFYLPEEGDIKVMGESLTASSRNRIRSKIAYVPQNSYLFNLSVKENIRLGRESAMDEEVVQAAKAANAHDFIMSLPNGYDTILNNGGSSLSGGEQQRIAIARAFVRKAPLLLMDEATSSLDNENDNLVQEAIKRLAANTTAIIVAHKPTTIAACTNRVEM